MTGAVFLASGGGAEDTAPLDAAFASAVGSGPLWYWPIALEPVRYAACLDWLTGVFGPLGVTEIDMWDGDGDGSAFAQRLQDYRGVYIGGGNTYRLLDIVRRNGLLPALRTFIDNGGVAYGGSAGAAILGADITTVAHLDSDPYGTTDTAGVDRVAGHGVFVHYQPSEVPLAQEWTRRNRKSAIALPERAGAVIEDGRLTAVGHEPVQIIDGVTHELLTLAPGESIW